MRHANFLSEATSQTRDDLLFVNGWLLFDREPITLLNRRDCAAGGFSLRNLTVQSIFSAERPLEH
jgi:hypothetical protein